MTTETLLKIVTLVFLGLMWTFIGYELGTNVQVALVGASIYTTIIWKD